MEFSKLNEYYVKDKKAIRYYDTLNDMISDETLKTNMFVKTKGYYNINDLGSAFYYITDDNTDDTKYYVDLDNDLYAVLIIDSYTNVEVFGAYGDNEHDDTNAIQNAIDFVDNVIFSNTYIVNNQISINKSVNLIGNDNAKIKGFIANDYSLFKVLHNNVHFNKLNIDLVYSGTASTAEYGNTISIGTYYMNTGLNLENFSIKNCNIKRSGVLSYNIGIFGDTHNVVIENNKLYGECINLHWSGDFNIEQPHTSPCTKTYHPYNVIIKNNLLENNRGIFISSAYNVDIANNTFINNTTPLTIAIGDYGNTMAISNQKDYVMTGITIKNCSFKESTNECITFQGFGNREDDTVHKKNFIPTSRVNILNCSFSDSTTNPNKVLINITHFYGININNCKFNTTTRLNAIYASVIFNSVIKNSIFNVAGHPISIFGSQNLVIENCICDLKSGYNFFRCNKFTFNFTELTYNNDDISLLNNIVNGNGTHTYFEYANNVYINKNSLIGCNMGIRLKTSNNNFNIMNNIISDNASTLSNQNINIQIDNGNIVNVENNKLNGGRGVFASANANNTRVFNNTMIGNSFSGGLLLAIAERNTSDIYISGNIVDSNANVVYGNNYHYLDFSVNNS